MSYDWTSSLNALTFASSNTHYFNNNHHYTNENYAQMNQTVITTIEYELNLVNNNRSCLKLDFDVPNIQMNINSQCEVFFIPKSSIELLSKDLCSV